MSDYKPLTPAEVQEWESILLNDKTKSIAANNALEMVYTIKAQDNQLQAAIAYVKDTANIVKDIRTILLSAKYRIEESEFESCRNDIIKAIERTCDIT